MIKRFLFYSVVSIMMITSSCETIEEPTCFPTRITTKTALGTSNESIIADYKYEDESLSHILWSNYQTHYFEYNSTGSLIKVSRKNVQTYQNLQSRFTYDGELPVKSDEYRIMLDRFTQEDTESTHTGYREFSYDGMQLVEEKVYEMKDDPASTELARVNSYEYDMSGNMTKYIALEKPSNDTIEAFNYVYDDMIHPYSALNLAFEGESHVNNVVQKTDLLTGEVYDYQLIYNNSDYPVQLNIKIDSYLSEIITIEYACN